MLPTIGGLVLTKGTENEGEGGRETWRELWTFWWSHLFFFPFPAWVKRTWEAVGDEYRAGSRNKGFIPEFLSSIEGLFAGCKENLYRLWFSASHECCRQYKNVFLFLFHVTFLPPFAGINLSLSVPILSASFICFTRSPHSHAGQAPLPQGAFPEVLAELVWPLWYAAHISHTAFTAWLLWAVRGGRPCLRDLPVLTP